MTWVPARRAVSRIITSAVLVVSAWNADGVTRTWTGAANALWSNPGNWGGTAPVAGDSLVFPSSATNMSNTNDLPTGTSFNTITITAPNYTLNGNAVTLVGLTGPQMSITATGGPTNVNLPVSVGPAIGSQFWAITSTSGDSTTFAAVNVGDLGLTIANGQPITINTLSGNLFGLFAENGPAVTRVLGGILIGTVRANAGTLDLDGGTYGQVLIEGGTLRLAGTPTTGPIRAENGTLTVSPLLLTATTPHTVGYVSLSSAMTFQYDVNPSVPVTLGVTGTVGLVNATLAVTSPGGLPIGTTYTMIDNDETDSVIGTFRLLPEGSTFNAGGQAFRVSYVGGSGNDVTISVLGPAASATTSTITATPNPAIVGQTVTVIASVTGNSPAGTVIFFDSSNLIGTSTLSGGQAAITTSWLSQGAGTHSLTAMYIGDSSNLPSTSAPIFETVTAITPVLDSTALVMLALCLITVGTYMARR